MHPKCKSKLVLGRIDQDCRLRRIPALRTLACHSPLRRCTRVAMMGLNCPQIVLSCRPDHSMRTRLALDPTPRRGPPPATTPDQSRRESVGPLFPYRARRTVVRGPPRCARRNPSRAEDPAPPRGLQPRAHRLGEDVLSWHPKRRPAAAGPLIADGSPRRRAGK